LAASLSTPLHRFAFVFPAFGGAGFAQAGAHFTNAVSEGRTTRKQDYACSAKFKAFSTKPDAFRHCFRVHREAFIAAFRTPAYTLQTVFNTLLDYWI